MIDFLCDDVRGWHVEAHYEEDGRVVLVHPLFDYPLIVITYDLLTDTDVHTLLGQANIAPREFDGLYGVQVYVKIQA